MAAQKLLSQMQDSLASQNVLSFASFGSEISTRLLNQWLLKSNTLLLPRVEGDELSVYLVLDLSLDLCPSRWGVLEPNPDRCEKIEIQAIQTALVPGLAFDASFHRLGYGQGHYDRLLKQTSCRLIGLAFAEQTTDCLFPDPWDVPLHSVSYF
jgi:5-formyltetrahydrofolate cyclo-ligase